MTERRQQNMGPQDRTERRTGPRRRDLSRALGDYVTKFEEERASRLAAEEELAELQDKSFTDSVTGVANRAAFDEKFPELVSIAETNNEPLALLFADSNDLHLFNKVHGHKAGDELLRSTAQQINECSRDTDLVARIGGDEFAAVLTGFKPVKGTTEAELIQDTARRYKSAIGKRAAVGIVVLQPGETADELYARADAACTLDKPEDSRRSYGEAALS